MADSAKWAVASADKNIDKNQSIITIEPDLIPPDPVAQQHELLVSEIESTDGHLGTALR